MKAENARTTLTEEIVIGTQGEIVIVEMIEHAGPLLESDSTHGASLVETGAQDIAK